MISSCHLVILSSCRREACIDHKDTQEADRMEGMVAVKAQKSASTAGKKDATMTDDVG